MFFTLFLIFLNSQPIHSLSKARSDPYWEEQSLQKINQSNTVFKQFLNSFFCHSLNCFDSFKYSSAPACIFILYGQMIPVKPTRKAKVWSWAVRPMTKSLAGSRCAYHQHIGPWPSLCFPSGFGRDHWTVLECKNTSWGWAVLKSVSTVKKNCFKTV